MRVGKMISDRAEGGLCFLLPVRCRCCVFFLLIFAVRPVC